jgi:hypothetical protein
MKTITSRMALFCLSTLLLLGGCGGGGGSNDTQPAQATPAATKAIVKLSTVGTLPQGTQLSGVAVTVQLPAGLSVATDANGAVATGVVTASGVAILGGAFTTYTAATATAPATLQVIVAGNFGVGEFVTIACDIASGSSAPTATDVKITGFSPADQTLSPVTSLTSGLAMDLK